MPTLHSLLNFILSLSLFRKLVESYRRLSEYLKAGLVFWHGLKLHYQNFVLATIIVLILRAVMTYHPLPFITQKEDAAFDLMMAINPLQSHTQYGFVFLDMDEESFQRWQKPFHVPRDKLAQLIEFAVGAAAKIIVVDVDINDPGVNQGADQYLETVLANYKATSPPLILLRIPRQVSTENVPTIEKSFLEASTHKDNIYWGDPTFYKDSYDQTVRRWRLLTPACLEDNLVIIPSIQLIADMLVTGWRDKLKQLNAQYINTDTDCTNYQPPKTLEYGERRLTFDSFGQNQRLIYSNLSEMDDDHFTRRPAFVITDNPGQMFDDSLLKNKIVIIGASYAASRDFFSTPIEKKMPGTLVLTNAIRSMLNFGQIRPPSLWISILIQLSMIATFSWLFAKLGSFWGFGISVAAICILIFLLSGLFFAQGVWLDYSMPILVAECLQIFTEFFEGRAAKKHLSDLLAQSGQDPNL